MPRDQKQPGSFPFTDAVRRQAKLRIALDGPSGSGKTHSALLLALGLVDNNPLRDDGSKRIGVIDTEKNSASLEAGKPGIPEFQSAPLGSPYTPARYVQLIKIAAEHFDVLIIDSLSHAWSAEGGILDTVDQKQASQRNKFAAWREVTPMHNALVEALLQADCHIIACIRTKTHWDFEEDDKGKKKPVKVGLKPEQREGIEYEFTLVFDLSLEKHIATASKDRTSLFDTQTEGKRCVMLTPAHGKELADWMNSGAEPLPKQEAPATPPTNGSKPNGVKEITRLYQKGVTAGVPDEQWKAWLAHCEIKQDESTHTPFRFRVLCEKIDAWVKQMENPDPVPFPDDEPNDVRKPPGSGSSDVQPDAPRPDDPIESIDHDTGPLDDDPTGIDAAHADTPAEGLAEFFEDPTGEAEEDQVMAVYNLAKKHAGIQTAKDFLLFCKGLTGGAQLAKRNHSGLPVLTNAQVATVETRMATMAGSGISKTNQELDLEGGGE